MQNVRLKVSITGGSLSITGALAFLLSGFGYQWGWWGLGFAFRYLLFYGGMLGLAGLIISFLGFVPGIGESSSRGIKIAVVGIALGGITLTSFSYWYREAQKYPPIHDITTDTENPPQFEAIVPLRADAPNPTEYGGAEVAKVQKEHYPDIQTLQMAVPYPEAFDRALEAARSTSWEMVAQSKDEGRIEATHTLPWYGFKDDVVIRVDTAAADSTASIIDIRSVSRIGRGDIGVNAKRIRDYLAGVKPKTDSEEMNE